MPDDDINFLERGVPTMAEVRLICTETSHPSSAFAKSCCAPAAIIVQGFWRHGTLALDFRLQASADG